MFAEVVAIPPEGTPGRLGERFTLREGLPLLVGPSAAARLRLGPADAADLRIVSAGGAAHLEVPAPPPPASLNGHRLTGPRAYPLAAGDTLLVSPGLALTFRERPLVTARDADLERQLLDAPDDTAAGAVYRDLLEEQGDPLAEWLRRAPTATDDDRLRALGPLAALAVEGQLHVRWTALGLLELVHLGREATESAPGWRWVLDALGPLPVARCLAQLSLALLPRATPDADPLAAVALEHVARQPWAPSLASVNLGFVSSARQWPWAQRAWGALRQRAPRLPASFASRLVGGGLARLRLLEHPPGLTLAASDVVLNPSGSDVGSAVHCLVRLVGPAPAVACTLQRHEDGAWVLFDRSADPFAAEPTLPRVNGAPTARATLAPGDVVEPVPGLRLRFTLDG